MVRLLFVAAGALIMAVVNASAFHDPTLVPHVTIENPSEYDIRIDVAADGSTGRMPLGTAAQQCTTTFDEVIDQGSTWMVSFATQARDGGAVAVARADLASAGWRYRIPDGVVDAFRTLGTPPPPDRSCATP